MDKYDELLARLDNLIRTHEGKLIDCHDAAAAIRELEAKLDAERKAREEADEHAIDLRNEIIRLDAALAAPASPLLPGREREVTLRMSFIEWMCGEREHPDTGAWFDRPEGAGAFWWRKAIRAEISRLNGEGRGS